MKNKDFVIPTVIILAIVINLFIIGCQRKWLHESKELVIPVMYKKADCPNPPGCEKFITQLATASFRKFDRTAIAKLKRKSIIINTENPERYRLLKEALLTDKELYFKISN